ncbi:anaerobic ribonucleoside-triphosphate reductase activating protein [Bacillus massiliigorillae]|uniref:anaerobic ribonucleoside-triphosphate reductase activating protein n=1 Tax=Bacillus massiliigorillae TaxID=1243664 RepID=UPI0003A3B7D2|nr:anaerobic ribonucleoside-triphosphate reductase activating protein [Bacillus massiliigorillae]
MKVRVAAPLTIDSIVDGPGLRMVLWTQGCPHRCEGCHNPKTHSLDGGFEVTCASIIEQIHSAKLQRGITLSGGDPFLQAKALLPIAIEAKKCGLDIWAYTGYCWEELMNERNPHYQDRQLLLQQIDVLVDGRFIEEKKSHELLFRGSSNQRIIDVKQSLESDAVVLCSEYM